MKNLAQTRRMMLGALLAATTMATSAQAQMAGRPVPPPGNQPEVVINCCECIGKESPEVNISTGTAPWRVSSVAAPIWQPVGQWMANPGMNGPSNTSPLMVPGNIGPNPLAGTWTNKLAPAAWLQPSAATTMAMFNNGHYTYKLRIRVPNCSIKQKVTIKGQIAADDVAKVYVDGTGGGPVALSPTVQWPWAGFGDTAIKDFNHVLPGPGIYTLRVELENLGGGPTGIVINGKAWGICDDRLVKGKDEREDRD